jgi:hypothetical protein
MTGRKSVPCPTCSARVNEPCRGLAGQLVKYVHQERIAAVQASPKRRP